MADTKMEAHAFDTDVKRWANGLVEDLFTNNVLVFPVKKRKIGIFFDNRRHMHKFTSFDSYLSMRSDQKKIWGIGPMVDRLPLHHGTLLKKERSFRPIGMMFFYTSRSGEKLGDMVFIRE